MTQLQTALGLMSGTSLDGIDAAIIRTDGERVEITSYFLTLPYEAAFQEKLHGLMRTQDRAQAKSIEHELTVRHADAVKALLKQARMTPEQIDVIGFHGQTIAHAPERGMTWQIGDGALLAELTGIGVVNDFRTGDVKAGGQGAPLVPLFHAALARDLPKPVVFLNIGGVANVTWIGEESLPHRLRGGQDFLNKPQANLENTGGVSKASPDGHPPLPPPQAVGEEADILAFDTGPGNALVNDWVKQKTGKLFDEGGDIASRGRVDTSIISNWLKHEYFRKPAPKSLDRNDYSMKDVQGLSLENGAATLTAFTVAAVAEGARQFPKYPQRWYVCGGGRHNREMMRQLKNHLRGEVLPVERLGLNGDAIEAEAFAYLAVRSLKGLPLTLPRTTGRPQASQPAGGVFYPAGSRRAS